MPKAGPTSSSAQVPAVELSGLVKDFSIGLRGVKLRAVANLNLRIEAGQVFGLLGPNGSGKSTTIKILLGLLSPTEGVASIFGVPSSRVEARCEVGYLPEAPNFYRHLTGRELVHFYARLSGLPGPWAKSRTDEVLELVDLIEAADRRVRNYSKGMLQRVGLAQALVHDPKLLILDEPTAGVDPVGSAAISELILTLKAAGKTVLITSHLLGQIEEICDRVAILDRGKLVFESAVSELPAAVGQSGIAIDALKPEELAELRVWFTERGKSFEKLPAARVRLDRIFLEKVRPKNPSP